MKYQKMLIIYLVSLFFAFLMSGGCSGQLNQGEPSLAEIASEQTETAPSAIPEGQPASPDEMGQPAATTQNMCGWSMKACPEMHKNLLLPLVPKNCNGVITWSPKYFMTQNASKAFMSTENQVWNVLKDIFPSIEGAAFCGTFGDKTSEDVWLKEGKIFWIMLPVDYPNKYFEKATVKKIEKMLHDDYFKPGEQDWVEEQYVHIDDLEKLDVTTYDNTKTPAVMCQRMVEISNDLYYTNAAERIKAAFCPITMDEGYETNPWDAPYYRFFLLGTPREMRLSYALFRGTDPLTESKAGDADFLDAWNKASGDMCMIITHKTDVQDSKDPFSHFLPMPVLESISAGIDFNTLTYKGELSLDKKQFTTTCGEISPALWETFDILSFIHDINNEKKEDNQCNCGDQVEQGIDAPAMDVLP